MLTPRQSKMARAGLGLGVRDLAAAARVSANTVARLERGEQLKPATVLAIRGALEAAGAEFLGGEGGPIGVQLREAG